jgi:hypothetical protein
MNPLTLTEKEMAEQLKRHPVTLRKERLANPDNVPPFFKTPKGGIRYIASELPVWIKQQQKQTLRNL